jgi:multimeric flavodoxin WrbA
MKILVLYQSNTGNTEKMAKLVAEGAESVSSAEVRLRDKSYAWPQTCPVGCSVRRTKERCFVSDPRARLFVIARKFA